jgi:hypothetical protein
LPHGGKCGLDFRGSCDGSSAFCRKQIPTRRAAGDGDDDLRRPTGGGGGTSAIDGNAFAIAADDNILDHNHFGANPARRDATIDCSHAAAQFGAAELLIK